MWWNAITGARKEKINKSRGKLDGRPERRRDGRQAELGRGRMR
jgi:hypothetical protein